MAASSVTEPARCHQYRQPPKRKSKHYGRCRDANIAVRQAAPDPQRPTYSSSALEAKITHTNFREVGRAIADGGRECASRSEPSVLFGSLIDAIPKDDLTDAQYEVLMLRIEGFTFESIGRIRGHTHQGAVNIFNQAVERLVNCDDFMQSVELALCYREEVGAEGFYHRDYRVLEREIT